MPPPKIIKPNPDNRTKFGPLSLKDSTICGEVSPATEEDAI
jgi:hypothetical protein